MGKLHRATGNKTFSGETFTGGTFTTPTLTTPIINVGSDATGDIYYRNASGLYTRLAKGTQNYLLRAGASIPEYAAPNSIIVLGSDANGDIYYRNGGVLTRLAKGSNGQFLTLSGGIPAWASITGLVPSGSITNWFQAAAPSGWTIDNTGLTDAAGNSRMMCAVHSNQYGADGGSENPVSWTSGTQYLASGGSVGARETLAGDVGLLIGGSPDTYLRARTAGGTTGMDLFTQSVTTFSKTPYYRYCIVCTKD